MHFLARILCSKRRETKCIYCFALNSECCVTRLKWKVFSLPSSILHRRRFNHISPHAFPLFSPKLHRQTRTRITPLPAQRHCCQEPAVAALNVEQRGKCGRSCFAACVMKIPLIQNKYLLSIFVLLCSSSSFFAGYVRSFFPSCLWICFHPRPFEPSESALRERAQSRRWMWWRRAKHALECRAKAKWESQEPREFKLARLKGIFAGLFARAEKYKQQRKRRRERAEVKSFNRKDKQFVKKRGKIFLITARAGGMEKSEMFCNFRAPTSTKITN